MKTRYVASLLLLLTCSYAHAEKWVYVGTGKNNTHVYADTDSVVRKGDLASIHAREGATKSRIEVVEYDCANRMAIAPSGPEPIERYAQFPFIKATYDLACKRWYEIWK